MAFTLACLQRCEPILRRTVAETPARLPALPAIEVGFETAWTWPFPGSAELASAAAAELECFEPQDIDDPVNDGDGSYNHCVSGVVRYLRGVGEPLPDRFHRSMFDIVAGLMHTWFTWSATQHGRTIDREAPEYNSALLLERSTQLRHLEWLELAPLDEALLNRLRTDSLRRANELVEIINEWWAGPPAT